MTDLSALTDRIQALAGTQRAALERNRARAPEFAAFVDEYRRVFGPGVRVAWVRWPDGSEQGTRA